MTASASGLLCCRGATPCQTSSFTVVQCRNAPKVPHGVGTGVGDIFYVTLLTKSVCFGAATQPRRDLAGLQPSLARTQTLLAHDCQHVPVLDQQVPMDPGLAQGAHCRSRCACAVRRRACSRHSPSHRYHRQRRRRHRRRPHRRRHRRRHHLCQFRCRWTGCWRRSARQHLHRPRRWCETRHAA